MKNRFSSSPTVRLPISGRLVSTVLLASAIVTATFDSASAQTLGTAQSFGVLGGSTVTNTNPTSVVGDLGVSPGSAVTGFPPGLVTGGTIHAADAVAAQAQSDTTVLYNSLAGRACNFNLTGQNLGGMTLVPGVYCFSSSASLTGDLTLDAQGDPAAVWIFQIGSTLISASNARVLLLNGAQPCNVFWQVGSSATLGTDTTFVGNIVALTSITLTTRVNLVGRALARNGAVTLDTSTVTASFCAVVPVVNPPTLNKAFAPLTILAGGVSTLTITLANPNASVATLTSPFVDTLPNGLVIANTPNVATTCGGSGAVLATAGGSTVTVPTGRTIPANGSCTVSVNVTAPIGGICAVNTLPAGALATSNGNNVNPAVATLCVTTPPAVIQPTVGKSFSPAGIFEGEVSTLSIALFNPNATPFALSAPLVDTLPSGVLIAAGLTSNTCAGLTATSTPGGSALTLTGSIPVGSCTVTVPVTAALAGTYLNLLGTAQATLIVIPDVAPPVVVPAIPGKTFDPATVFAGVNSTLRITVANPNDSAVSLSPAIVDTLPSGLTIATPLAVTTNCGILVGAIAGGFTITLSGGSIPAHATCTVSVTVNAAAAGTYINNIGAAFATLLVIPTVVTPPVVIPPTVGKAFGPGTITAGQVSLLTITVTNPNNTPVPSPTLIDTLPAGVTVAAGGKSTSCGIVRTSVTGSSTVTLMGGTIPANGVCAVTTNVSAAAAGTFINSLNGALATLVVLPVVAPPKPPTFAKAFSPSTITAGGVSTLTITVKNPNASIATAVAFTDNLPNPPGAGQMLVAAGAQSNTCGGTLTATTGGTAVTLTGGSIAAGGSCTVTVKVTATVAVACDYTNILNGAKAVLHVIPVFVPTPKLTLVKTADRTTYTAVGQVITYTYKLTNSGSLTITGPFTVTDDKLGTFACGLVSTLAPGASVSCKKTYTVKATDLCTATSFPPGKSAYINASPWLTSTKSTQDTVITNHQGGLPNGTYSCWCIQNHGPADLHNQPGTLYSTIGTGMPADIANLAWRKINYVLNHKGSGSGLQFLKDVQTAISKLAGEPNPEFGISAGAQQLINAANANANFVPGSNEISGAVIYPSGMFGYGGSIKKSICEIPPTKCNKSIVNHATASAKCGGANVTSPSVSVTVKAG